MLPMDAKRNADSYSYPNGMLNSGWIVGVLRLPGEGKCFIQQTASENHMLPVEFDPRQAPLPRDLKEWDLVMAYCHFIGARENDVRIVRAKSIRFESPNLMHMDKRFAEDVMRKWSVKVHAAAKDSGVPAAIEAVANVVGDVPAKEERMNSVDWRVLKLNKNATNTVQLAGFVQAKSLERNRVNAEGKPMNDRLVVLLRQTEDPDKSIPIRWYGRNLEPLANTLTRGLPIKVQGEYRLDVKALGAPDPESGIAPVSKLPYIEAKDFPGPVTPDSGLIKIAPFWVAEMLEMGTRKAPRREAPAQVATPTGIDSAAILADALNDINPKG